MFVIAHNIHPELPVTPVYLWKISFGANLITHDLNEATKFRTQKQAKEVLASMREDSAFDWKVYPLGIVA